MVFENPAMLYGLVAAMAPVLLHLLNRSRYRTVSWGAMMFLQPTPRSQHSASLKQWGLLLLRTTIIALIALALARPVLFSDQWPRPAPGRSAAVMVLDRSASMSLNDNGRLRLDLAKEAIFQLLSPAFKGGDDLWLLKLGDGDPAHAAIYAGDPQSLAQHVQDVNSAAGTSDIAGALDRALDLVSSSDATNREIYLVCDRLAQGWNGVTDAFIRHWRQRGGDRVRLFVVPVGSQDTDNVAVDSISIAPAPVIVDQPFEAQIEVRNFGSVPRAAVPLVVEWRDATGRHDVLSRSTINLPALASTVKKITIKLPQPGSIILSASISAPGLATDKRLDYSLPVIERPRVLVIDSDEGDASSQSASDFLRLALAPFHEAQRNMFSVDVARPDLWSPGDLASHEIVILTNVPTLTETQSHALQQFVFDGGGIIVAPGDQTRIENYNTLLPWLPGTMQLPVSPSESGASSLQHLNVDHPVLQFLNGSLDIAHGLEVRRYFPVIPQPDSRVLAEYSDGKPFIVSRAVGLGRSLLMTTPIDPQWNNLPLTDLFLPLAQSMARFVAGGPSEIDLSQRNVDLGAPLLASFEQPTLLRELRIVGPGGVSPSPKNPSLCHREDGADVKLASANLPGIYTISAPAQPAIQFAVRTPQSESDLTPLSGAQLQKLSARLGFKLLDSEAQSLNDSQQALRAGQPLWLPLISIALLLGFFELLATGLWVGGRV
jgi:hypothetical protein